MPVAGLPPALADARLIHLSDIHAGTSVSKDYLQRAFATARALRPDIAVCTGDWICSNDPQSFADLESLLPGFPRGRLATVAVLGNHDYGAGWSSIEAAERLARMLRDAGVTLLRNETTEVAGVLVHGLGDLWSPEAPARGRPLPLERGTPALVLAHNPDACDEPDWNSFAGWVLSGHTHGGQCRPPFLPPPVLPVRNRRYTAGEIALDDGRRLYINRGLGHLLRVRFNVRPEITCFTLQPA
ncbi:MAG: metallophosphoesterase [Opitutaceae bacterium]